MDERVVPHNLEAERALLGSVLLKDAVWADVSAEVEAQHFFRAAHQEIYEAMRRCKERGLDIGLVTLKDTLGRAKLDEVGGPAYIAALIDGRPLSTNIRHYATVVREKALLRAVIDAGTRLVSAAYGSDDPPEIVLEEGVRSLLALSAPRSLGPVPVAQAVQAYVESLDADAAQVLPTGYADLDDLLSGGLRRRELSIVAARPSVGKSSFALGVAKTVAQAGLGVAYFSLGDMSREALAGRLLAWESRQPLRRQGAAEIDGPRLAAAIDRLSGLPLVIEDGASTLTQLHAWGHRLAMRDEGLALLVVDFVQQISMKADRRHDQIGAAARGLKRLAIELDAAVLACSQLNRAPEGRQDKRPHMSDLKESGALEEAADVAVLLFREEMHKRSEENRGIAEAILAKQRNGPTGVTKLYFNDGLAQFADLALPG